MPDRIPNPSLSFRQRVVIRLTSPTLWFGIAAAGMAAAFIILAVNLTAAVDDKAEVDTCRSKIAGDVQVAGADVQLAVGDGLRALRNEDVAAAGKADGDYVTARGRLDAAKARRERSEEICAR